MAGTLMTRRPRSYLSPWRHPFSALRDEMEDLMEGFRGDGEGDQLVPRIHPLADISETDTAIEVRMDLPGFKADQIDIQMNHNFVTISGERTEEKEEKGKTFHRVERRSGSFSRSFTLPCGVIEDEVAADFHDGVLTVTLPKTEESKTRKITVKS